MKPRYIILACLALLIPPSAMAQMPHEPLGATSRQEIVTATLVSEYNAIEPGQPAHLGVLLEPQPGWHTYWENPGDAGMPISLAWTLPKGFSAGKIEWPAPDRISEGPLVTYSYHENVFLPVTVQTPSSLDPEGNYHFRVKGTWLVCKDICIPETAEMELILPVGLPTETENAGLFAEHRANVPMLLEQEIHFESDGPFITLSIPLPAIGGKEVRSAVFFPRQYNTFEYAAAQESLLEDGMLKLKIRHSNDAPEEGSSGILSVTMADQSVKHYDITLSSKAPLPAATASEEASRGLSGSLPGYLLLALLGGIILNLMPCVLPVLSLKTLAIAKKAGKAPEKVKQLGLAYTLGILLSFALIAGLLIGLRQTGEAIGWGYQMQSPAFVGFLAYLLFLVGLNLSGMFDLPVLFGSSITQADDSSVSGSFYTGVLAAAVATPCTAPFMATAVGAALTMPPLRALLIFEALGLGLALPFLLVSLYPALLRFLPRPGAWMERFKQFLAFPMYASVIWLVWVLILQTGPMGAVIILSGMLLLAIVIWLRHFFPAHSPIYRAIGLVYGIAILGFTLPMLQDMESMNPLVNAHEAYEVDKTIYSPKKLSDLRLMGKPVFLDATAAWCLTCQLNGRVAIHTDATMRLFKERGITLMVADWTRPDSAITDLLSSFGHKGVPLYVYYPPNNAEPVILPQLLTEAIIREYVTQ